MSYIFSGIRQKLAAKRTEGGHPNDKISTHRFPPEATSNDAGDCG
jgi:hypothetical protein